MRLFALDQILATIPSVLFPSFVSVIVALGDMLGNNEYIVVTGQRYTQLLLDIDMLSRRMEYRKQSKCQEIHNAFLDVISTERPEQCRWWSDVCLQEIFANFSLEDKCASTTVSGPSIVAPLWHRCCTIVLPICFPGMQSTLPRLNTIVGSSVALCVPQI